MRAFLRDLITAQPVPANVALTRWDRITPPENGKR